MTRLPLLLVALLGLAGCDPATTATIAGASLVSLIYTDKTLSDHAASQAFDENCSVLHTVDRKPYCQEIPAEDQGQGMASLSASLYCYRTLGGVSCYDRPDYMASQTRLNYAHGYLPPTAPGGTILEAPVAALPGGTY
jgi:hypothetical protein